MKIGMMADPWAGTLEDLVDEVAFASRAGLDTYWLAQVWRFDAMTMIPHLAATAPNLNFATGVVATWLRHPLTLATQALTTALLTEGRFTLGVGLMHRPIIEGMLELPFDRPIRHMREFLDVLLPLLSEHQVDVKGETLSYHGPVDVPGAPPCPVVIAALGAQMLDLAGARTEGTITWMTGPNTVRTHIIPKLQAAAERVGRPEPRVVALVPVHVTDEVIAARTAAAEKLSLYGQMPSYRAMHDREGSAGVADAAAIGSEDHVREQIAAYATAGVTDIGLSVLAGPTERDRTRALIASL